MAEADTHPAQGSGELDEALLRAISHPLRHRLLGMLDGRTASPNQLARELDLPLGRVSYHIRLLADLGAIELVRTEPRRGALEHFYRAVTTRLVQRGRLAEAAALRPPRDPRPEPPAHLLQRHRGGRRRRLRRRRASVVLRAPLELDERGLEELSDAAARLDRPRARDQQRARPTGAPAATAPPSSTELAILHSSAARSSSRRSAMERTRDARSSRPRRRWRWPTRRSSRSRCRRSSSSSTRRSPASRRSSASTRSCSRWRSCRPRRAAAGRRAGLLVFAAGVGGLRARARRCGLLLVFRAVQAAGGAGGAARPRSRCSTRARRARAAAVARRGADRHRRRPGDRRRADRALRLARDLRRPGADLRGGGDRRWGVRAEPPVTPARASAAVGARRREARRASPAAAPRASLPPAPRSPSPPAAFTAVLFLLVLELVAGFAISPLRAALGVTVLPIAALVAAAIPGDRAARALAGRGAARGRRGRARVPARAGHRLDDRAAGPRRRRDGPRAARALARARRRARPRRTLIARHVGIVLVLAILAPVANARLRRHRPPRSSRARRWSSTPSSTRRRSSRSRPACSTDVDAVQPPRAPCATRSPSAARTSPTPPSTTASRDRLDDVVVGAIQDAFRISYLIAAALALIGAALLISGWRRPAIWLADRRRGRTRWPSTPSSTTPRSRRR